MDRRGKLAALKALAALIEERAVAPVAAAQSGVDRARAEVAAIRQARQAAAADAQEPVQAAMMARQAERLRRREAEALSELAARQAVLEIAKAAAAPAIGRRIVLDRLLASQRQKG